MQQKKKDYCLLKKNTFQPNNQDFQYKKANVYLYKILCDSEVKRIHTPVLIIVALLLYARELEFDKAATKVPSVKMLTGIVCNVPNKHTNKNLSQIGLNFQCSHNLECQV